MPLDAYRKKRRFGDTPEPRGVVRRRSGRTFVVQKHRARRLHYDLRLEMEGVLRSWAIPKGPSLDPAEKRLAVQTEDHPVDYGDFEGIIPQGNYGAGKVIVWDHGTYEMLDPETPEEGWEKRKFHVRLKGTKLGGEWVLVQTGKDTKQWLFFKVRDEFASSDDVTEERPESVISGLRIEDLATEEAGFQRRWYTEIERELEKQGVKKGPRTRFPEAVSPMLATLIEDPFDDDEWLFEIKLDGVRALAYKNGERVELRSRNQNEMTQRFPSLVRAFGNLPADSLVIDGEIVAFDGSGHSRFSLIQPRLHLSRAADVEKAEDAIPVFFYAFDLLYINGYSLMGRALEDRKALLRKLLPESEGWIRFTDHVETRGREFFEAAAAHDLEGIVAKRRRSTYHQRRSRQWLKIKTTRTEDFVVVGFTRPSGSRKSFGALVLGLYDSEGRLLYTGRVGSGFDDRGLESARALVEPLRRDVSPLAAVPKELSRVRWIEPELVCEVRFSEWTADGKLRAPVFSRFRDDIDPRRCVLGADRVFEGTREEAAGTIEGVLGTGLSDAVRDGTREITLNLTNLGKVFWPGDGFTKGDLITYYREISEFLVPYLVDRPLVLKRYPDGIEGEYFYQKDAPEHTPDWVRVESLWSEEVERSIRYFVGADRELLMYLANLGAITQNPWSSRLGRLDRPDFVIFDLDPAPGVPYRVVQKVALELKKVLDELELRAYAKTSGASGIHVYLPLLEDQFTYREVRTFAEAIASVVVARAPERATIERSVRRRPKGVYVDFLQNVQGKTVASVYSPRARPGAPVSTPLRWEELRRTIEPTRFNMRNIFRRLERVGDLFAPVLTDRQDISGFLRALASPH